MGFWSDLFGESKPRSRSSLPPMHVVKDNNGHRVGLLSPDFFSQLMRNSGSKFFMNPDKKDFQYSNGDLGMNLGFSDSVKIYIWTGYTVSASPIPQ